MIVFGPGTMHHWVNGPEETAFVGFQASTDRAAAPPATRAPPAQFTSYSAAAPWPPPMHMVTTA